MVFWTSVKNIIKGNFSAFGIIDNLKWKINANPVGCCHMPGPVHGWSAARLETGPNVLVFGLNFLS